MHTPTWLAIASVLFLHCCESAQGAALEERMRSKSAPAQKTSKVQPAVLAIERDDSLNDLSRKSATELNVVRSATGGLSGLQARAKAGDALAQLALGATLATGDGDVRRDQALSWLTRAAEAGNLTAQYNLGILYVARGEMRDAYQWFYIAAERSSGRMQRAALRHRRRCALVMGTADMQFAVRDANDWLEEYQENSAANSADDGRFRFDIDLPPYNERGWRQTLADYQRAARDGLGWADNQVEPPSRREERERSGAPTGGAI